MLMVWKQLGCDCNLQSAVTLDSGEVKININCVGTIFCCGFFLLFKLIFNYCIHPVVINEKNYIKLESLMK